MNTNVKNLHRIIFVLFIIGLTGCTSSGNAYIQIKSKHGQELEVFYQVTSIISETQFKLSNNIRDSKKLKRLGFIYDPNPSSKGYYFIDIATEVQKGIVGIRFSEVGKKELSKLGKSIFNSLLVQVQDIIGEENVTFGTDEEGYNQLRTLVFNY